MAVMDESERASTGPCEIAGMEDMMGSAVVCRPQERVSTVNRQSSIVSMIENIQSKKDGREVES